MNPDTLVVVHCYQGDADQVQTFMPWYTAHQCPVLVLSPEDSPVNLPQAECRSAGKRGWKGQHTLARQLAHWKIALEHPQSWFFLNDADSMCLTAELPAYLYANPFKFWCNVLCHENEHREDDHPNLNPPYFMHRSVLQALVNEAEQRPELDGHVPPDHDHSNDTPEENISCDLCYWQAIDGFYTNLVINRLQIPYEDYPDGATTWPRGMGDMIESCRRGARMLHGAKNGAHIMLCQSGYNGWVLEQQMLEERRGSWGFTEGDTIQV